MNDVKTLKIALVAVIAIGAVFGGVYAYRYQQLNSEVAGFSEQIQTVETEEDAKVAVQTFLDNTSADTIASSASAKKDGTKKKCKFGFFGFCFVHDKSDKQNFSNELEQTLLNDGDGPSAGSGSLNLEGSPGNANGNYSNYAPGQTQVTPSSPTTTASPSTNFWLSNCQVSASGKNYNCDY